MENNSVTELCERLFREIEERSEIDRRPDQEYQLEYLKRFIIQLAENHPNILSYIERRIHAIALQRETGYYSGI
jgi:hypothetical protein